MERCDAELLRAHLEGDRLAFAELVRRHAATLWAVALRTLSSREDAADAVQDALLHAHQRAAGCRASDSVRGWLVRIVVNACLDRYRHNRSRPSYPMCDTELARLPAPRDPIGDDELRLDVTSALARLPFDQRVVVVLVDMHGYPTHEVAGMLGVPVGTVKSRASRGRERLAHSLGHLRALETTTEER
ncbi:MAG TPA: RNA polymerase sigma factor SigM [Pseudonocardia sp.]